MRLFYILFVFVGDWGVVCEALDGHCQAVLFSQRQDFAHNRGEVVAVKGLLIFPHINQQDCAVFFEGKIVVISQVAVLTADFVHYAR